ncbi:MAG: tyrosine-type recombinase/integrase [Saprospiraceae bacterium]|nr:tyrosine-type recombinase/integrase [Saprospiraceae bacterium]
MVTVQKIIHRDKTCILLRCQPNEDIVQKIRKLPDSKYSRTHQCWYIPYEKENWHYFIQTGLPYVTESSGTTGCAEPLRDNAGKKIVKDPEPDDKPEKNVIHQIEIHYNNQRLWVKIPYRPADVSMIKNLHGAYWNNGQKLWSVVGNTDNLAKLQSHFNYWSPEIYGRIYNLILETCDPKIVEIFKTPEYKDIICVKLKGYGIDQHFIQQIANVKYDPEYKRWVVPKEDSIIAAILTHFSSNGTKVINRLCQKNKQYNQTNYSNSEKQQHLISKFSLDYQELVKQYTDVMLRRNNSWSTIYTYVPEMVKYAEALGIQNIAKADHTLINEYFNHLAGKKIAVSTIHTSINAVKYYYQKVIFRMDLKIEQLVRPKKGFHLPTILSTQEVNRLLECVSNTKHIVLLFILYGGGLRLNEVISMQVNDIWWDRNQMLIRSGKGNKDRVVMLSQTLKQLLRKYFNEFMPQQWLFEGQDNQTQYSERSVQNVVKNAVKKAGITKKVSPHTLRHCFATHLLDAGIQLPYIQTLLGHKDVKTTMIYTHVTTQSISHVVSPLDNLSPSVNRS